MYLLYLHGANGKIYSLADVGKAFGKTRQAVYDQFRVRGFKLRSKSFGAVRVFDGRRYMPRKNDGYWRATTGDRRQMHVAVWEKANGPLPKGYGTLATGGTTYAKFNPVTDAANVIATLEESILDGAAWYMHRTVWAAIRSALASSSGLPFLFLSGAGKELSDQPGGGPIKPAGEMAGYTWFVMVVTTPENLPKTDPTYLEGLMDGVLQAFDNDVTLQGYAVGGVEPAILDPPGPVSSGSVTYTVFYITLKAKVLVPAAVQ
jgi:hypothetical protein